MFRQKQYDQMTVSTASAVSPLDSGIHDEDFSVESSTTENEARALKMKSLINAKVETSIKTTEQILERRRSSIEEGATGLLAGSDHFTTVDCSSTIGTIEPRKRVSGQSVSAVNPLMHRQEENVSGLSASDHGTSRPAMINHTSDLDLNALQKANPLRRGASWRRRKISADDEPSAKEKHRARLFVAQNGSRRASIAGLAYGEGQKGRNCRELAPERLETRPRLRKFASNRSLSDDSDYLIELKKGPSESHTLMQRSCSEKRLSSGSDSSWDSGDSSISRERPQRSTSSRTLSIDANSKGNQPNRMGGMVRKNSSRRKLLKGGEPIPATAKSGTARKQSVAHRRREFARSRSFSLAASNAKESADHQSPADKNSFTWTWKTDDAEPLPRRSSQSSGTSNASPSLEEDLFSSPSARRLSMPTSSDFDWSDHPMSSLITTQRQQQRQTKISPKRTSTATDSLMSPGARRTSRSREHSVVSPPGRSHNPKLPLYSPDSKNKSSTWKKSRGTHLRREASKSKIITLEANDLDVPRVEDVVNKKDIGTIAKALKESNQAKEEWLRQKEEEREAKRSHVRARRRRSLEWTS